jgi:sugar phosphate isomerase/epimerase
MAHHDLLDAVELLAELGYRSIAITLEHGVLNPWDPRCRAQVRQVRRRLVRLGMGCVVETGARYLLDPRRKHEPTLMAEDPAARQRRIDFLCRAIDIAVELSSDCVSLWSGALRQPLERAAARARLIDGLQPVLRHAERREMTLGFEPEPGMFIDTMDSFAELAAGIDSPRFRLTLDVGHLHCLGEVPIPDVILQWRELLVNVHIEDMRRGVHEHLMFGEGELDFPPILAALSKAEYMGGLHVELSRHSHDAPRAARQAHEFLSRLLAARAE